jgi:hypothetical protein
MEIGRDGGRDNPALPTDNAEHGTLPARFPDRVVRAVCRALAVLWWLLGLRQAAGMLRHYLSATGAPYGVDARELLGLPPVRDAVATQLAHWRAEALARGVPGTHPADSRWRGVLITRRGSTDWWLALRGLQYRLTGTIELAQDGSTRADCRLSVHKSWNFDRGGSECGVPFTPFARLHETGLAREFTVIGECEGLRSEEPPRVRSSRGSFVIPPAGEG